MAGWKLVVRLIHVIFREEIMFNQKLQKAVIAWFFCVMLAEVLNKAGEFLCFFGARG